jgi:Zn-dependent membrane protease YugP
VTDASRPEDAAADRTPASAGRRLARNLALYTVARLLLVAVIAAVILGVGRLLKVDIPLIVALLFGVLIALPVSMVAFKRLRTRVNESIAAVDEKRRTDKAQLRARLRGEEQR